MANVKTLKLCAAALGLFIWSQSALAQQSVSVCVGALPPPKADATGTTHLPYAGWSLEVFALVFRRLNIEVKYVDDLPWARCLNSVAAGQVDFALGAYHDAERARKYTFSRHYLTLTPQVFYRAQNPIQVSTMADLRKYKGCGITGSSYAHYGLPTDALDLGVSGFDGLVIKLKAGRCDYFVEELEVIAGLRKTGRDYLDDPDLRHNNVADAKGPTKHLITAKDSPVEALMPKIDKAITALVASGDVEKIWKKYEGNTPFNP